MKNLLWFVAGATVGSLVTWKLIEKYYMKLADEEIESVVEHFKELENKQLNVSDKKESDIQNSNIKNVSDFTEYDNIANKYKTVEITEDEEELVGPYVISPEEFDENGYEVRNMTYYSDDVLVDDTDKTIVLADQTVGNALEHFGEYEDDCVHVRDDYAKIDYEIIRVNKTFKEAYNEEEE